MNNITYFCFHDKSLEVIMLEPVHVKIGNMRPCVEIIENN